MKLRIVIKLSNLSPADKQAVTVAALERVLADAYRGKFEGTLTDDVAVVSPKVEGRYSVTME